MKHKHSNRILGRTANHRHALLRQLTSDILQHGAIVTTPSKAKELQKHLEPLITAAKKDMTLHTRRTLRRQVATMDDVEQLTQVAAVHSKRPGGYTRLTKIVSTRHDNAPQAKLDIIDFNAAK